MEELQVYKSPYPKIRIGKQDDDGGYAVCQNVGSYDFFLSGGVADNITFEEDFLRKNTDVVHCFAFDGTVKEFPKTKERISFFKMNLAEKETESTTNFHKLLEKFQNVFLKLDIEGHEFRVLPTWFGKYMKNIKQMVIEIHTPMDFKLHPEYYTELQDVEYGKLYELLGGINQTHTLVHFHPNNGCGAHRVAHKVGEIVVPNVFECTYLRNDLVSTKELNTDPIPSAIDVRNHSYYNEMSLEGWPYKTESKLSL